MERQYEISRLDAKGAREHICEWNGKEDKWKLKEEYQELSIQQLLEESKELKPEDGYVRFRTPKYQEWEEEFKKNKMNGKNGERPIPQVYTTLNIDQGRKRRRNSEHNEKGEILHECIEKMKKVSRELLDGKERPWSQRRRIDESIEDCGSQKSTEIEKLLETESVYVEWFNRAISFDFINFTTARQVMKSTWQRKKQIDWDLFDLDKLKANQHCTAQRLISLYKVAPNIARVDDVRPIMVQRHLVKFMECSTWLPQKISTAQGLTRAKVVSQINWEPKFIQVE